MTRISFIDGARSDHVRQGLSSMCATLGSLGIAADWYPTAAEARPGTTLLLHDPVDEDRIPRNCRVYGQRILNRRLRLVLAEQCGLPVPKWRALERANEIVPLLDEWGVSQVLYKADYSYQRKGIRLVTRGKAFQRHILNPAGDVFMTILDGSDHTLKIDVFFDEVIACRKTYTRSIFDPKFYVNFTQYSSIEDVPPIRSQLRALGRELVHYGAGLTSVDVMIDREGQPWVIELNTSSVGREATWRRWPDLYLGGYVEGIRRWVGDGCPGRCASEVGVTAAQLSQTSGGRDAPHVA